MTMNFAAAASKVRDLLAAPRHSAQLSQSALTKDSLRDNVIRDAIERSPRFKSAASEKPSLEYERDGEPQHAEWDTYGDCLTDFARAAFGFDEPELLDADRIRPSHRLSREALRGALSTPEFRDDVRPYARANEDEATMAAVWFADELKRAAAESLGEHAARSQEMSEQEQAEQTAEDRFEQLREQARQEVEEQGAVQPDTRREIKQALKAGDQARERLGELMAAEAAGGMLSDARATGRAAVKTVAEQMEAWSELPDICKGGRGYGTGDGPGGKANADAQLELAKKWTEKPHLRALARMLGRRVRNMTRARKTRVHGGRGVVVGVETGRNLHKLLPRELARACSPVKAMRTLFVKDYVEGNLLQYRTEIERPAGKGSIIAVLDGSGTMEGDRREWAGSVEIGLLILAHREKRAFAAVHFGSANQLRSWVFPKGQAIDPHQVLDVAEQFFNGGTSIVTGMADALRILRSEPAFKTADIVLITDGICPYGTADAQIREQLRALGVRIHGVSILAPRNAYMEAMCEYVIDVADLAAEGTDTANTLATNLT